MFGPHLLPIASLLLFLSASLANVEKTIFLGPETINVPHQHPSLEELQLDVLSPAEGEGWSSIRTHITAEFPSAERKFGKATWLLLDGLIPARRYEVRVCWAATQPTAFRLDTFEVPLIWDSPDLITSLAEYSTRRIEAAPAGDPVRRSGATTAKLSAQGDEHEASVLLLRILAAAEYVTTNETLMKQVQPVHVDIILDPFVLNVLPRSLLPTVGYILVVAAASWFLIAGRLADWVQRLSVGPYGDVVESKKER